jgi:small subunit ribosomal protein S18
MTSKKNKLRAAKMAMRKHKKRPNPLTPEKIEYIDYKDVNLLQRFMSDRSKLRARRMTGTNTQQQRDIATAVKNAREMALLPYTKRVAAVRGPRSRDDRREDRGDGRESSASYAEVGAETSGDVIVTTAPETAREEA